MRPGFQNPILEDGEWLAAEYESKSIAEIAAEIGVSSTSVLRALKSHGIERRGRHERRPSIQHPLLADRDWLVEQYSTSTATAIAASIGVDRETVRRALRFTGSLPIRHRTRGGCCGHLSLMTPTGFARTTRHDPSRRWPRSWAYPRLPSRPRWSGWGSSVEHGVRPKCSSALRFSVIPSSSPRCCQRRMSPRSRRISAWLSRRCTSLSGETVCSRRGDTTRGHGWKCLPTEEIVRAWEAEETIKGVARQFEVSVNTAAVWLARVGDLLVGCSEDLEVRSGRSDQTG